MAKKKNTSRGRKRPKPRGGEGVNENCCPHAAMRRREAATTKASFEQMEAVMTANANALEARMAIDNEAERQRITSRKAAAKAAKIVESEAQAVADRVKHLHRRILNGTKE